MGLMVQAPVAGHTEKDKKPIFLKSQEETILDGTHDRKGVRLAPHALDQVRKKD